MVNVVVLAGRLVADVEVKKTSSGSSVAGVRLAVDRIRKDDQGNKITDFFDVTLWGKSAEFAGQYLGKGRLVAVTGSLQVRSWTDKDGQKHSRVEVNADTIRALDSPKKSAESSDPYGE